MRKKSEVNRFWPLRPRFDPVIHLGHVLSVITFILMGFGAWYGVKADISKIDYRVTSIEKGMNTAIEAINKLTDKAVNDARQDEKINSLDKRLDRLETAGTGQARK